jgi:DNA gyrase subunit B
LKGLDAVHKRPGMYIGDTTDGSGLHNMVYEVVDNAINEALAGHCDRIEVVLNTDGSVTVRDNGHGIPTNIHEDEGVSVPEIIMTRLHASWLCVHASLSFEENTQEGVRLPRGVGIAVVNALSETLDLRIWREGREHFIRFRMGDPEAPLAVVGNANMLDGKPRHGTEITFLPSPRIFTKTEFDFARVEHRLRELASDGAGVTIMLADKRGIEKKEVVLHI